MVYGVTITRPGKAADLSTEEKRNKAVAAVWLGFYQRWEGPAAEVIQKWWRGHAARRFVEALRQGRLLKNTVRDRREELAAVLIQRYWRGFLARREAEERRKAAVDIQRWWKGYRARKDWPRLRLRWRARNYYATDIQRWVRGHLARKLVRRMRQQQQQQQHQSPGELEGADERRVADEEDPTRAAAATVIQAHWRGYQARKRRAWLRREAAKRRRYEQRLAAAKVIQSYYRGWYVRRAVRRLRIVYGGCLEAGSLAGGVVAAPAVAGDLNIVLTLPYGEYDHYNDDRWDERPVPHGHPEPPPLRPRETAAEAAAAVPSAGPRVGAGIGVGSGKAAVRPAAGSAAAAAAASRAARMAAAGSPSLAAAAQRARAQPSPQRTPVTAAAAGTRSGAGDGAALQDGRRLAGAGGGSGGGAAAGSAIRAVRASAARSAGSGTPTAAAPGRTASGPRTAPRALQPPDADAGSAGAAARGPPGALEDRGGPSSSHDIVVQTSTSPRLPSPPAAPLTSSSPPPRPSPSPPAAASGPSQPGRPETHLPAPPSGGPSPASPPGARVSPRELRTLRHSTSLPVGKGSTHMNPVPPATPPATSKSVKSSSFRSAQSLPPDALSASSSSLSASSAGQHPGSQPVKAAAAPPTNGRSGAGGGGRMERCQSDVGGGGDGGSGGGVKVPDDYIEADVDAGADARTAPISAAATATNVRQRSPTRASSWSSWAPTARPVRNPAAGGPPSTAPAAAGYGIKPLTPGPTAARPRRSEVLRMSAPEPLRDAARRASESGRHAGVSGGAAGHLATVPETGGPREAWSEAAPAAGRVALAGGGSGGAGAGALEPKTPHKKTPGSSGAGLTPTGAGGSSGGSSGGGGGAIARDAAGNPLHDQVMRANRGGKVVVNAAKTGAQVMGLAGGKGGAGAARASGASAASAATAAGARRAAGR